MSFLLKDQNNITLGYCSNCQEYSFLLSEYSFKLKPNNPWNTYVCINGCIEEYNNILKNETKEFVEFIKNLEDKIFNRIHILTKSFLTQKILPEHIITKICFYDSITQFISGIEKNPTTPDKSNYYRLDYCQDCGRYGILREAEACAEGVVGYGSCCRKYICNTNCYYICPNNHWNQIISKDFHDKNYLCDYCPELIPMNFSNDLEGSPFGGFSWWGISPNEWLRNYN